MIGQPRDRADESTVAAAFDTQSAFFDQLYSGNAIIQYKRQRVRSHVETLIRPDSHILELNAGTGEDAVYFAGKGHRVHATDISSGMQQTLRKKAAQTDFADRITIENCSFTRLDALQNRGPYDLIFSNFAGLNCTSELGKVIQSFDSLLNPGGIVTMVILPKFCLWETMLLFRGKWKTAFRRFTGRRGTIAHIEGTYFKCWYYDPSFVISRMKPLYSLEGLEGLCTIVPPSYIEGFAEKYPKTYRFLRNGEHRLRKSWPWRSIGDYYILSLRKIH